MGLQWTISPNEYAVGFVSVPTTDFKPNMEGEIVPISLPRRTCSQQLRPGWAAILTLISVFVAVACATQEPLPTYTPMPTHTPYPTLGALPTHTPFPTWRPFPTATPTPAPTYTPWATPTATPRPTPAPVSIVGTSSTDVYNRVAPSVAFIETPIATGSGVLIEGGYVVTNHHVIWPFESVDVTFPDDFKLHVPVAAWDPLADIAVLGPLDAPVPPPLQLQDGESLPIGSELYLVGYPAGQATITRGILSGVREWEQLGMTYFQTDAAITGGQSGGRWQMPTARLSESPGRSSAGTALCSLWLRRRLTSRPSWSVLSTGKTL